MSDDAFARSVRRAIDQNGGLSLYAEPLFQLRGEAMADSDMTPVALTSAHFSLSHSAHDRATFTARALAFNGYGVEESCAFYRHYRKMSDGVPNDMLRLMSEDALVEQYGNSTGMRIAETLCYPDAQPLLYALLFKMQPQGTLVVVERPASEVLYSCRMSRVYIGDRFKRQGRWQEAKRDKVDRYAAEHAYYEATGQRLSPVVAFYLDEEGFPCGTTI